MVNRVELERAVDYGTLEDALKKAAKDVGWDIRVEDKQKKKYQLGSIREIFEYERTQVTLKNRLLPALTIFIYGKGKTSDFHVLTKIPFGFASEGRIQKYLEVVSYHLNDS